MEGHADALGAERFHLVGHDWGAATASGAAILALWWITKRRDEVAAAERAFGAPAGGGNGSS